MSTPVPKPSFIGPAKYLTLHFEGYFMCRLATDPDPTNEHRGLSGYTMALSTEDGLDQELRLRVDESYLKRNLREPGWDMGLDRKLRDGIRVGKVTFDGKPWPRGPHPLLGATVNLLGRDTPAKGVTFESRNNITGSDDTMAFVVDPFRLEIVQTDPGHPARIYAQDYLNPTAPEQQIWEILDPKIYGRRLSGGAVENSTEVAEAINVWDLYGYFYDRRRYLNRQIELLTGQSSVTPADQVKIEQYRSRLYQLDFWGDRVISKMGTQVTWKFDINGPRWGEGDLGGTVDAVEQWPVKFWCGGWDGDLLVGFLRGHLNIPFTPR